MKRLLLMVLVLAACATDSNPTSPTESAALPPIRVVTERQPSTPTETPYMSDLPTLGAAPELHDGIWLNTDLPLKLADLRGKVVLLEMWTFGCINCLNTLPSVIAWHEQYASEGLVIIGNHYPEFAYERDLENLKAAVKRLGIEYPVLQDNNRETWAAYRNRYWPTIYLIDKWGNIRYKHIGEGRYTQTDAAIRELLAETYPG